MQYIPLAHGGADAFEHIPRGLIGHSKLARKLYSGDPPFTRPGKKQKTDTQRHMSLVSIVSAVTEVWCLQWAH